MTYAADFYITENIIGYMGNPNVLPTVFFQQGLRFGHISQSEANPIELGRSIVQTYSDYRLYNNRDGLAEEFYNGAIQSTYDSPLFLVTFESQDWRPFLLSTAILSERGLKSKYLRR